jgi:hypothetical protein
MEALGERWQSQTDVNTGTTSGGLALILEKSFIAARNKISRDFLSAIF